MRGKCRRFALLAFVCRDLAPLLHLNRMGDFFALNTLQNYRALLLPAMFPDSICLIADIDLFPLQKEYFQSPITHFSDDKFIVYRDKAYPSESNRYPMSYLAAKGSTFKEIFAINKVSNFPNIIDKWHKLKTEKETDVPLLYETIFRWKDFSSRCVLLGHVITNRIDRRDWHYDKYLLVKKHYIDARPPAPYNEHSKSINQLLTDLGIELDDKKN